VSAPAVVARDLARRFGRRWALAGVSLSLEAGECLAVFGPNGAGKTTLLRTLAGLLAPTAGSASIAGITLAGPSTERLAARAAVGLISHQSMLYPDLTARENVEFAARLYGVDAPGPAAMAALEQMRVLDRADTPVRQLSRGLQQRVSIARAFVHTPRVVLLDEPFTGLDAVGAAVLTEALGQLKTAGAALILVTHNLDEGLALATWVAVLREGRFTTYECRADVEPRVFAERYRRAGTGA
jgi:heme ABC exporter ATP-binding subunit CcmA